jgi:hypothetical protein
MPFFCFQRNSELIVGRWLSSNAVRAQAKLFSGVIDCPFGILIQAQHGKNVEKD